MNIWFNCQIKSPTCETRSRRHGRGVDYYFYIGCDVCGLFCTWIHPTVVQTLWGKFLKFFNLLLSWISNYNYIVFMDVWEYALRLLCPRNELPLETTPLISWNHVSILRRASCLSPSSGQDSCVGPHWPSPSPREWAYWRSHGEVSWVHKHPPKKHPPQTRACLTIEGILCFIIKSCFGVFCQNGVNSKMRELINKWATNLMLLILNVNVIFNMTIWKRMCRPLTFLRLRALAGNHLFNFTL